MNSYEGKAQQSDHDADVIRKLLRDRKD